MAIARSHENAVVVTPQTLKHQIITRIYTLVNKSGGSYFPTDENGNAEPIAIIEGVEIQGIQTKGRNVYLIGFVGVPTNENISINLEDGQEPYNANDFYIEHLWEVYLGCESLYQSRFADYGSFQDV